MEETQQETPTEQTPEPEQTPTLADKLMQAPEPKQDAAPADASDPWESDDKWKELIPEKFRKDGEIDYKNLAKSYLYAEKRIGSGDIPPKDETGYKLEYQFPEGVGIEPERETSFLKGCHAKGMTNAQVQYIMDEYANLIKDGMALQAQQQGAAKPDIEAQLRQEWGAEFDTQFANAQKAFHAVADEQDKGNIKALSQSVPVMRMLAKLGANLNEDPGLPGEISGMSAVDVESLQKSEAYWNPRHPDHSKVKQQVTQYFQAKFKGKSRVIA